MIAALSDTKVWKDTVDIAGQAAAFGFLGLLLGGVVEAVRSWRANRPASWGEPTLYGTVIFGLFAAVVGITSKI